MGLVTGIRHGTLPLHIAWQGYLVMRVKANDNPDMSNVPYSILFMLVLNMPGAPICKTRRTRLTPAVVLLVNFQLLQRSKRPLRHKKCFQNCQVHAERLAICDSAFHIFSHLFTILCPIPKTPEFAIPKAADQLMSASLLPRKTISKQ